MSADQPKRASFWTSFKNVAILFSFIVNLILVVVLLVVALPLVCQLKVGLLDPILTDLDAAFVSLGEATIDTTVQIDESIPIQFDLPLDESLPIGFELPIEQDTTVVLQQPVPLYAPATFRFPGSGGAINGTVSLSLPPGMALPVRLSMVVPVSQTVPVVLDVPVDQDVPIQMDVPVQIELGESGLGPVVGELRASIEPAQPWMKLLEQICGLPKRIRTWFSERLGRGRG
jgi:hypothetical protein